jgi:hypothetical protein
MSHEFHHKRRYAGYFMAPLWIALALCGMALTFLLGGFLIADEWSRQDQETLAAYKSESPSSALERAAEAVKHDRIEFAVYRNLLRATLAEKDEAARSVAFHSIRDVLLYGGAFADDLKAELKNMAPQVLVATTTSKAGVEAGNALEKELRNIGMTIVDRETRDPAQISESKVSCYSADTCKDAKALVPLLRARGYTLGEADASSRSEDNSNDVAATLYNAKVIRIVLSDPKLGQPTASRAAASPQRARAKTSAHHPRPSPSAVQTAHQ